MRETSAPFVDVRGHRAFGLPAQGACRLGAALIDASTGLLLLTFLARTLREGTPVPRTIWLVFAMGLGFALWALQRLVFSRSLGELVWGLRPKVQVFADRLSTQAFQSSHLPLSGAGLQIVSTLGAAMAALAGSFLLFLTHPGWLVAVDWQVEQSGEALKDDQYVITPFFYALGAWPRYFGGKPVFYGLPYAKGPPDRFVPSVIARWDSPDVRVVFEGRARPRRLPAATSRARCFTAA